jgi:hypothetical protein
VLTRDDIAPDREFASRLDLGELGRKPADEELEPAGEIQLPLAHTLNRLIELRAVATRC